MNVKSKLISTLVGVMSTMAVAFALLWGTGAAFNFGRGHDLCGDMYIAAQTSPDPATAQYRLQEYEVCSGDSTAAPSPSAAASTTPSVSPTPTEEPTVEPTDDPDESRDVVFHATLEGKVGINAYGPQTAQDPSLGGISLEGMSAAQFLQEMSYRIDHDPMLAASFSLALQGEKLDDTEKIDSLVHSFLADYSAWDSAVEQINAQFDTALSAGATTQHFAAGSYATTYSIVGTDGVPYIRTNADIWRDGQAYIDVGGVSFRYACGGQPYWANPAQAETTMPTPSAGMTVDAEGTPTTGGSTGGGSGSPDNPSEPVEPNEPSNPENPTPDAPSDAKSAVPNADGVTQPEAGTTTVDESREGQGSSSEPAHGSDDLGSDTTGTGGDSGSSGGSDASVSDGNTSELENQDGSSDDTDEDDTNTGSPEGP